ncbi:MAG: hypothetical protein L3J35_06080 [Bacteroidales bacterium]|nr:hypothetical protein [Bacteroidales bacterium]
MNRKSKIISISGIVLIILIIGAYIIFSDKTICKAVEVEISADEKECIIDESDIKKIIFKEYKNLLGSPISIVNLSSLEKKIESHPSVKNAEVFKKINGILVVKLKQKVPIVRIMPTTGKNFYIDKEGSLMPVSKIGSARVLVANGNINFKYKNNRITVGKDTTITKHIQEIYKIAKVLSEDEFLKAQTEQIYIKQNNEYELIPKVGNHIVLLGDIYNYENKIKYLKHFYINILKKEGWRKYKYINLKYKNQIVCTKSNK